MIVPWLTGDLIVDQNLIVTKIEIPRAGVKGRVGMVTQASADRVQGLTQRGCRNGQFARV